MYSQTRRLAASALLGAFALTAQISGARADTRGNPCNPCAATMKNPCAAGNPCAPRNPCAASTRIDPKLVSRPPGTKLASGNHDELVEYGKKLFKDAALSTNGLSCNSCHADHGSFNASFAKPYPHTVAMAKEKAGRKQIQLDEMVQACIVMPMAAKPLPWNSKELAALTAYTGDLQKTFKPAPANPCAARNPCAPGK